MTVLTAANALPNLAFPQHLSGQTNTVQSFVFPGAVQPAKPGPKILSFTNAFLGISFPQHLSGQTAVQNFMFPGAVQPPGSFQHVWGKFMGHLNLLPLALLALAYRNPSVTRRRLWEWMDK